MLVQRKKQINEDDSQSDDEPLNYEMNFLEEIKGHLEILSFDTTLHDIYEPVFSDGFHLSPKTKSDVKQSKPLKYRSQQNIFCSIDQFCLIEQQQSTSNEALELKLKESQQKITEMVQRLKIGKIKNKQSL